MEHVERVSKVLAYITRTSANGEMELLVFEHRDYPEAGTQVPAGTVEQGELPQAAVVREVEEETGLQGCTLLRRIALYDWFNPYSGQINERHVFHLSAPANTQDKWDWIETGGGRVSEQAGYVFQFRWVPLADAPLLAGHQDDFLHEIR